MFLPGLMVMRTEKFINLFDRLDIQDFVFDSQ